MDIAILSGAIKNAGDYLITERCMHIIEYVLGNNVNFTIYSINDSLNEKLEELNEKNVIIVPGGPISENEYPGSIPLVSNLKDITAPMFAVGLGWYGERASDFMCYSYHFSQSTMSYLNMLNNIGAIACRDWYTYRVFKNHGLNKPVMTGCPAWYDLEYLKINDCKGIDYDEEVKIAVSDPSKQENMILIIPLIEMLRRKFKKTEIHFLFHRGISADKYTHKSIGRKNEEVRDLLENNNVFIHDISYSSDGFKIYDKCDIHIGFRVHAHLYCLSHRMCSLLIEEDGRGAGANEALGLDRICAYSTETISSRNAFVIQKVEDCLLKQETMGFMQYKHAFDIMQERFECMKEYVKLLNKI